MEKQTRHLTHQCQFLRTETRRRSTGPSIRARIGSASSGLVELSSSCWVWTALLHGSVTFPKALPYDIVDLKVFPRYLCYSGSSVHGPVPLLSLNFLLIYLWIPYHPRIGPKAQKCARIICSHNYYYFSRVSNVNT